MDYFGGTFSPAPPVPSFGGGDTCFWRRVTNATADCYGSGQKAANILGSAEWGINVLNGSFFLQTPSLNACPTGEDSFSYYTGDRGARTLIFDGMLYATPDFSYQYQSGWGDGMFRSVTVFRCALATGDVIETYPLGDVAYSSADYGVRPIAGMPFIDPAFSWYAMMTIDVPHNTTPSKNIYEESAGVLVLSGSTPVFAPISINGVLNTQSGVNRVLVPAMDYSGYAGYFDAAGLLWYIPYDEVGGRPEYEDGFWSNDGSGPATGVCVINGVTYTVSDFAITGW